MTCPSALSGLGIQALNQKKGWASNIKQWLEQIDIRRVSPRPLRVLGDHVRGEYWTEARGRMYKARKHRPFLVT